MHRHSHLLRQAQSIIIRIHRKFNNNNSLLNLSSRLTILQHNVLSWNSPRKHDLANEYLKLNPDIILLNGHGRKNDDKIKIFPYTTYQRNTRESKSDGVAILVRNNIPHKVSKEFNSEALSVTINTQQGDVTIATAYLPPSRPYWPTRDMHKLATLHHACYLVGDLNAKHRILNSRGNQNNVGKQVALQINAGLWSHAGPDFPTCFTHNGFGTPDMVLMNQNAVYNYVVTRLLL